MYILIRINPLLRKYFLRLKTDRLLLLVVIATLLFFTTDCFYVLLSLPWSTFFPRGDEPHYLIISQTILKYHSLDVMRDYTNGDYRQFYPLPIDAHVIRDARGQLMPLHNIGGPILWLIPYALLGRLGAVLFVSTVAVLCVVNIYKLLVLLGNSERIAFMVSLAYVLASPLYIYSHLTFVEVIGAFICIYAFRKILQPEITTVEFWLCATLIGLLPWVHTRFSQLEISLFCLLLYRLYRQCKFRSIAQDVALLLPVGILFLALEVYSVVVWGTWNPAASQTLNHTGPFEIFPSTSIFLGLFFDQEYGLLFSSPVFLFLLIGLAFSMRKQLLSYNLAILIVAVPYIILFASFRVWFGGYNPSDRYLQVVLPLFCCYMASALERFQNPLAKIWFYFSLGYGFLFNLASLFQGFSAAIGFNVTIKFMASFVHFPATVYMPSVFACQNSIIPNCTRHESILFVAWIAFFSLVALAIVIQDRKKKHLPNTEKQMLEM